MAQRYNLTLLSPTRYFRFHRAITRPFFSRERISDFEIYQRNSELSINVIKKRIEKNIPLDFQVLLYEHNLVLSEHL